MLVDELQRLKCARSPPPHVLESLEDQIKEIQEALSYQISQLCDEIDLCWNSDKFGLMKLELRHIMRSLEGLLKSHVETREDSSIEVASDDESICDEETTKVHSQIWGHQRIEAWKANAGKAKDWRICPLLKNSTKRGRKSNMLNLGICSLVSFSLNPHLSMPVNALKSSNVGLRKDLKPKLRSRKLFQLSAKRLEHERIKESRNLSAGVTEISSDNNVDGADRYRWTVPTLQTQLLT